MFAFLRFFYVLPCQGQDLALENIANRTACGNVKRYFMLEKPLTDLIWTPVGVLMTRGGETVNDVS
jgi:hypothetical protein